MPHDFESVIVLFRISPDSKLLISIPMCNVLIILLFFMERFVYSDLFSKKSKGFAQIEEWAQFNMELFNIWILALLPLIMIPFLSESEICEFFKIKSEQSVIITEPPFTMFWSNLNSDWDVILMTDDFLYEHMRHNSRWFDTPVEKLTTSTSDDPLHMNTEFLILAWSPRTQSHPFW